VLHAATLIQLRPTAYHDTSPLQLVRGKEPSISHLRVFGSAVYVPIPPPQRTAMGPHRKLGIYVGYETPSIIKYLEPMTGDLHTARYADCVFDEDHFLALGGDRHPEECQKIEWNASRMQSLDPRTSEFEQGVQRIIHLQGLANELPDAFTDHLRNQLKKLDPKSGMPLKWQLNLKLRKSLKDTILKMEIPMRRARTIALVDRNALAQSLWEITMSGKMIMRRSPLIIWNQESRIIERPLLSTYTLPKKLLTQWIRIQNQSL
jgi:hypothetical protein